MSPPPDRSKKTTTTPAPPSPKVLDELPPLPGMKGYSPTKQRPSLAPAAPPPVEVPAPTVTHELFDVESAAADLTRNAAARRAALRASAKPHPPRPGLKPAANATPLEALQATSGEKNRDLSPRLSTPLSWTAAKDATPGAAPKAELADAIEDEISDEFLEPAVDSVPAFAPVLSSEPLASAIPTGSVVVPAPKASGERRWGRMSIVALAAVGLVAVASFLASGGDKVDAPASAADRPGEPAAQRANTASEANPALRVPLPPLELDIGVPLSSPSDSAEAEPSAAPPVAPSGILPALPPKIEKPPFDNAAATAALDQAAAASLGCRNAGDPIGKATVIVRYAPSGRVTSATVEAGPFAGTATGGCIATKFRKALIPAFSGDYTTVKKTVSLR